jgi:zinc D-Ala-D-Ala dipeptidase
LSALRARPIPDLAQQRLAQQGARKWPIDTTLAQHGESIAPAERFGLEGRNHYAHARNAPYWHAVDGAVDSLFVRESVGVQLTAVDKRLRAQGLRLHLFDAWRPRAVQVYFHDVWMPRELRARWPTWSEEAIREEAARYWAAPTVDPASPAPHSTGGAVDLTIAWADTGEHLFMGGLFDDPTALSHLDRLERAYDDAGSYSMEEARANRRLLYWLMTEAGFACFADEWWHYSYGDQMWAKTTGQAAAWYGPVEQAP